MRIAITIVFALAFAGSLSLAIVFHTDVIDAERLIAHHQKNFAQLLPVGDPTTEAGRMEAMGSDYATALALEPGGQFVAEEILDAHLAVAHFEVELAEASAVRTQFAAVALFFLFLFPIALVWTVNGKRERRLADANRSQSTLVGASALEVA